MEIPRHWRLNAQRYRLEGSACPTCSQLTFPPRPVCTHCGGEQRRLLWHWTQSASAYLPGLAQGTRICEPLSDRK